MLALQARTAARLVRVLRLSVGAPLAVFDGAGNEHAATLALERGARVEVLIGARLAATPESPLAITLAQGLSRGERMDYAIQKATELGVHSIVPVSCERSVVRLDPRQAERRREHWRAVVIAACEQCGRARLPELAAALSFGDYLERAAPPPAPGELRALLSPSGGLGCSSVPEPLSRAELLIGPEGGLSEGEQQQALERGYRRLRLGPRVLRTETAAAAAIAVLQALRGDLG